VIELLATLVVPAYAGFLGVIKYSAIQYAMALGWLFEKLRPLHGEEQ
jgi:hypothetical protein